MMMAKQDPQRSIIFPVFVAIISGAAIQVASGLVWGGKVISRIEQLETRNIEQDKIMERMDIRGSQPMAILDQRLKSLEDTVRHNGTLISALQQQTISVNPMTQLQVDTIKQSIVRLEDQQRRISEVLDNFQKSRPK